MKTLKIAGIVTAVVVIAAVLIFILMAHGDEQVSGVAFTDSQVTDLKTLDKISSGTGEEMSGFDGILYATSCVEFGKYVCTTVNPVPEGKALYANILYIASPKGIEYQAVWIKDGERIKEETKAITSDDNKEAVSYMLDASLVLEGEYTFEVYYKDKLLYSQPFEVTQAQ